MTTPGGVPNLPTGALTLDTMASALQDTSVPAMKARAVERFPSIMDGSTGLSPASDFTPFGVLTGLFSGFNSTVAGADPADVTSPEDLPGMLLRFIEDLPVVGQLVGLLEALLGTYGGDDQILLTLQSWFGGIRSFLGGALTGNPFEMLQPFLSALSGLAATALNSANQATDIARQMMALVMQIVQGLEDLPIIGDFFDAVQGFAFWILGWFGITQQSVTDTNPAVAAANGRIAALESVNTVGLEGFADHFNRPAIGSDWADITPYPGLNIQGEQYIKASYRNAGRYAAKTLITDNVHAQAVIQELENGISSMYICCPPSASNAGYTSGAYLSVEHQIFPFNQGGRTTLSTGYLTGGLQAGSVLVAAAAFDLGNIKNGDVLAMEYYAASNTFFVFHNNNEVTSLRWTDTSNHVVHGSGHREIVLMQCSLDNASFMGAGWDDLSAYDIKVT